MVLLPSMLVMRPPSLPPVALLLELAPPLALPPFDELRLLEPPPVAEPPPPPLLVLELPPVLVLPPVPLVPVLLQETLANARLRPMKAVSVFKFMKATVARRA
jgi:hypothetical protein